MELVLASSSPRRLQLLKTLNIPFTQTGSDIDESKHEAETPSAYVTRMALEKAQSMLPNQSNSWILGADTAVVIDGNVLGKPTSTEESLSMLSRLSGTSHQVLTSVCLLNHQGHYGDLVSSEVFFAPLSEETKQHYVASNEGVDKAGGYAIQGMGAIFVERIVGSYSGIVGLPLRETAVLLSQAGFQICGPSFI